MTKKTFMKLQFIFVLLLSLTLVSNAFAWANRPAVQGGGFMTESDTFDAIKLDTPTYYINGSSCTAVTYKGSRNPATGAITYNTDNPIINKPDEPAFTDDSLNPGEIHYFQTVIKNTSKVKTNVTLFVSGRTHNDLGTSVQYSVHTPETAQRSFTSAWYNFDTMHNHFEFVPIVSQFEILGESNDGVESSTIVEWSVFHSRSSTDGNVNNKHGDFEISEIILTNN